MKGVKSMKPVLAALQTTSPTQATPLDPPSNARITRSHKNLANPGPALKVETAKRVASRTVSQRHKLVSTPCTLAISSDIVAKYGLHESDIISFVIGVDHILVQVPIVDFLGLSHHLDMTIDRALSKSRHSIIDLSVDVECFTAFALWRKTRQFPEFSKDLDKNIMSLCLIYSFCERYEMDTFKDEVMEQIIAALLKGTVDQGFFHMPNIQAFRFCYENTIVGSQLRYLLAALSAWKTITSESLTSECSLQGDQAHVLEHRAQSFYQHMEVLRKLIPDLARDHQRALIDHKGRSADWKIMDPRLSTWDRTCFYASGVQEKGLAPLPAMSNFQARISVIKATASNNDYNADKRIVFAGNLPGTVTKEWLHLEFSRFGPIADCIMHTKKLAGRQNCAYVEFFDAADAAKVFVHENSIAIEGRRIRVDLAKSRGRHVGSSIQQSPSATQLARVYTNTPAIVKLLPAGGPASNHATATTKDMAQEIDRNSVPRPAGPRTDTHKVFSDETMTIEKLKPGQTVNSIITFVKASGVAIVLHGCNVNGWCGRNAIDKRINEADLQVGINVRIQVLSVNVGRKKFYFRLEPSCFEDADQLHHTTIASLNTQKRKREMSVIASSRQESGENNHLQEWQMASSSKNGRFDSSIERQQPMMDDGNNEDTPEEKSVQTVLKRETSPVHVPIKQENDLGEDGAEPERKKRKKKVLKYNVTAKLGAQSYTCIRTRASFMTGVSNALDTFIDENLVDDAIAIDLPAQVFEMFLAWRNPKRELGLIKDERQENDINTFGIEPDLFKCLCLHKFASAFSIPRLENEVMDKILEHLREEDRFLTHDELVYIFDPIEGKCGIDSSSKQALPPLESLAILLKAQEMLGDQDEEDLKCFGLDILTDLPEFGVEVMLRLVEHVKGDVHGHDYRVSSKNPLHGDHGVDQCELFHHHESAADAHDDDVVAMIEEGGNRAPW